MIRFNGMDVIVHRPQIVVRTWKERLFSRPWRPLQRTKIAQSHLFGLDDRYFVMGGQIHCSEKGYEALMRESKAREAVRSTGYPKVSNGNGWAI